MLSCSVLQIYIRETVELTRETLLENGTSKCIQIDLCDLAIIWLIIESGHSRRIAVLKMANYTILYRKGREGPKLDSVFDISTYLSFKQSNNYEKREALLIFHQETSVPHLCECPYQGPTLERHSNQPDSFTSLSLFSCYC